MKSVILFVFSSLLLLSCSEHNVQEKETAIVVSQQTAPLQVGLHQAVPQQNIPQEAARQVAPQAIENSNQALPDVLTNTYFPIPVNATEEHLLMPFPSHWVSSIAQQAATAVQSNDGVTIAHTVKNVFYNCTTEVANQNLKVAGLSVAPVKDLNAIVETMLIPLMREQNVHITNAFMPSIVKSVTHLNDAASNEDPAESTSVETMATEWTYDQNYKSILVIERFEKVYKNHTKWGYYIHGMEAPFQKYEAAKAIFLQSLTEIRLCAKSQEKVKPRETNFSAHTCALKHYYWDVKEQRVKMNTKTAAINGMSEYQANQECTACTATEKPHGDPDLFAACTMLHVHESKSLYNEYNTPDYGNYNPAIEEDYANDTWEEIEIKD